MSKRIIKLWSLVIAVTMVASLFFFAVPAAQPASADYGNMTFAAQPLPTTTGATLVNGSDVVAMAQSTDGQVIYAIDGASAAGAVYKSTDGGLSFALTVAPAAVTLNVVAVAPDNSDVVAVSSNTTVYITSNGGSTWTNLPAISTNTTGFQIMDIGVGPARAGTLLGREYAAAIASTAAGVTAGLSDVQIIGNTAAWATIFPAADGAGNTIIRDWMAVKFTPNFVGDRTLVCVGANATADHPPAVAFINTATVPPTTGSILNTGNILTPLTSSAGTTQTIDFQVPAAAFSFVKASISLPTDFDATTSSGRRAYVGIASTGANLDNDAYRVDDNQARALGAVTSTGVWSVSYGGTVDTGTLLMGQQANATVKYTTQATTSLPTWTSTKKLMPTSTTNTVVQVAPNFATSNKVLAGTTGGNSAFSMSTDGGVTFDQFAIIDYGANALGGLGIGSYTNFGFTGDGKTMFLASNLTAGGVTTHSLWKTSVPSSASSWKRVYVTPSAVASSGNTVRLSPDYATTNTVYFFDLAANGQIFRSTDGGAIFNTRQPPSAAAISVLAIAIVDSNTVYVGESGTTPNVYKSTAGAFTWNTGVQPNVGMIRQLTVPKADQLLVGGTGFIAYSTDGGATFPGGTAGANTAGRITGANAAESYRITASSSFATDNTLFFSDGTATTGNVYRYVLGTDTSMVDLLSPNSGTAVLGTVMLRSGALYVPRGLGVNAVDRTLNPYETPGIITWRTTAVPTGIAAAGVTQQVVSAPNNTLWLGDGVTVWAYKDYLAAAKPELTSPADNYNLQIDPITGRADQVGVIIKVMGNGTGLVNSFNIRIWEKDAGVAASTTSGAIPVANPNTPEITLLSVGGALNANAVATGFPALAANKVYQFQIRATAEASGAVLDSPWSDARTINVQSGGAVVGTQFGPVLLGPTGGAVNVSRTPGFSWAPQFGATKYKFTLATDGAMTKAVAGTPVNVTLPSFQVTTPLEYSTTYFWSVQSVEPTVGPVSVGTFTTMATPPPPAPTTAPPAAPTPTIIVSIPPAPAPQYITPAYIWAIIAIGAVLVIAVIVLIARTRRPM